MTKIVILTGAGISAESGLETFRASDGLWAQHRVEECLQRAKGEAGLADYEVRTWRGWYHHQVLALTATWFLTVEARRGKKMGTGIDAPPTPEVDCWGVGTAVGNEPIGIHASHREPAFASD